METCGGDPVKATSGPWWNMIGFDVDDAGQKALKAVAEAGKETYAVAASGVDLKEHLKMEYARLGRKDLETTRRSGKWMQWTMR